MKRKKMLLGSLVMMALAFLFMFSSLVYAVPIAVEFEGRLGRIPLALSDTFTRGSTIDGSFTFESDTADARLNPIVGLYLDAASSFSLSLGDTMEGSANTGKIRVLDGRFFRPRDTTRDAFLLRGTFNEATAGDFSLLRYGINLVEFPGDVFSSDALPTEFPSLNMFDNARWFAILSDGLGNRFRIAGRLTSFDLADPASMLEIPGDNPDTSRVPEPATLILLGVGLGVFHISRRKFPLN